MEIDEGISPLDEIDELVDEIGDEFEDEQEAFTPINF